jgi:hypothetical protein
MQKISFEDKFKNYLRASYPILWIRTHEESRVTRSIINAVADAKQITIYSWDCKRLLEKYVKNADKSVINNFESVKGGVGTSTGPNAGPKDYGLTNAIESIKALPNGTGRNIIIMKDFHPYIEAPGQVRPIRNAIDDLKCKGNMLVFISPIIKIPVELEKEIQILDFHLPDEKQLEGILMSVVAIFNKKNEEKGEPEKKIDPDIKQATIEALKGLTFSEAHDAVSLAIIENHEFNASFVLSVFNEKVKQVKRGGQLQYQQSDITYEHIGGLDGLKKWTEVRSKAYSQKARDYHLPYPKGVLLAGELN